MCLALQVNADLHCLVMLISPYNLCGPKASWVSELGLLDLSGPKQ